jgi:hypothetical protein
MVSAHLSQVFPSSFIGDASFQKTLGDEFYLCDHGNMIFHWADFYETCEAIKRQLESNELLRSDFKKREIAISRLQLIPIWIRTKKKVYQLTMFDLYETYITSNSHFVDDLDPVSPIELSFISGTGPFKTMAIAECFSQITYKDFVMVFLLKDKLPKRDYRIRLKAKVLVEFGENFSQARLINLEQMTAKGLLLSLDWNFYMEELSKSEKIRILLETQSLNESLGKTVTELKKHLSQHTFNLMYSSRKEDAVELASDQLTVQSSFDFLKNKKIYLYIGYDKMMQGSPEITKSLMSFMNYSRDLIRAHYIQLEKNLKSA